MTVHGEKETKSHNAYWSIAYSHIKSIHVDTATLPYESDLALPSAAREHGPQSTLKDQETYALGVAVSALAGSVWPPVSQTVEHPPTVTRQ